MDAKTIKIFVTFLIIVIGLAVTPSISEETARVTGTNINDTTPFNLTGAALAVARLVPLFWVMLIIGIGVSTALYYLKS